MRAFIAAGLPAGVIDALENAQQKLRAAWDGPAKWTAPDGMHLTLAFLGNIADDRVAGIETALADTCGTVAPFQLKLAGTGVFPGPIRPEVIWIGLSGDIDRLNLLHRILWQNLSICGFTPENRPFRGHLTLARLRESASSLQRQALLGALSKNSATGAVTFSVDDVALIQSRLSPSGPAYSRLAGYRLTGK